MLQHSSASVHSVSTGDAQYQPLTAPYVPDSQHYRLEHRDRRFKLWVRILKFAERITALVFSAMTLTPLVMTLVKFFETQDIYYTVNGEQRTAWARNTITWYTYMYTAVAAVSCVFNLAVVLAYVKGVRRANAMEDLASKWEYAILGTHIVVWAVSAGIYRYGKEPVNGRFRDLWGWTCSSNAAALQEVVTDVNFKKYCGIQVRRLLVPSRLLIMLMCFQSASFYIGIASVGKGVLALSLYVLAFARIRSKKQAWKTQSKYEEAREPLRET